MLSALYIPKFNYRAVYEDGSDNPRKNGWWVDATLQAVELHVPGSPPLLLPREAVEVLADAWGVSLDAMEAAAAERWREDAPPAKETAACEAYHIHAEQAA